MSDDYIIVEEVGNRHNKFIKFERKGTRLQIVISDDFALQQINLTIADGEEIRRWLEGQQGWPEVKVDQVALPPARPPEMTFDEWMTVMMMSYSLNIERDGNIGYEQPEDKPPDPPKEST